MRKEEPTTKNATPREISEPRVEEYCTLVQSLDRDWSDITKGQLKKRVSKAFPMTLRKWASFLVTDYRIGTDYSLQ